MCSECAKPYDGHRSEKYFSKWIRDPLHAHFWMHFFFFSETILSPLKLPRAFCIRSETFSNKRFVLLSPITDWHVSPRAPEFHTGGLNIPHMQRDSPCEAFAACLKIRAVKSKKRRVSGFSFRLGQMVSLLKKCVCLSLALSDSYEFSNGNLASCVLTEIAPPAHLGSEKKKKLGSGHAE